MSKFLQTLDPEMTKQFSEQVELYLEEHDEIDTIDACLMACERFGFEPDAIKKLLTTPIRKKLNMDFQKRNLMPKRRVKTLPID